ncbi:hypothetical protein cypCar_00033092 [Cyprinus carpio]|nr:hypothetical protein cypCar_00033092 [Cyprinus carpio]
MSSSLPKSESTTSLIKTNRRVRADAASHRNGHRHAGGGGGGEDSCWTDECDATARRPLCQPKHGRKGEKIQNNQKDGPEHRKPSRHHHTIDTPGQLHGNPRTSRTPSPTSSLSKRSDEAALFFETKDKHRTGSNQSLTSSPPSALQPSSTRAPGRASEYSGARDADLHPIVKSVFGQNHPIKGSTLLQEEDKPADLLTIHNPCMETCGCSHTCVSSCIDSQVRKISRRYFTMGNCVKSPLKNFSKKFLIVSLPHVPSSLTYLGLLGHDGRTQDRKRSYKAVQSCDEGVTSGEALAALAQNSTYMHNVLGPACIFLRKGFAQSRQTVRKSGHAHLRTHMLMQTQVLTCSIL